MIGKEKSHQKQLCRGLRQRKYEKAKVWSLDTLYKSIKIKVCIQSIDILLLEVLTVFYRFQCHLLHLSNYLYNSLATLWLIYNRLIGHKNQIVYHAIQFQTQRIVNLVRKLCQSAFPLYFFYS